MSLDEDDLRLINILEMKFAFHCWSGARTLNYHEFNLACCWYRFFEVLSIRHAMSYLIFFCDINIVITNKKVTNFNILDFVSRMLKLWAALSDADSIPRVPLSYPKL